MRDQDAGPHVLPLLEHEDQRVKVKAINFLGWSRNKRATKSLCALLEQTASHYPEDYAIADSAATALGQIGSEETLPYLERAACHGVGRAMQAVRSMGGKESFDMMLKAMEHAPERCASMDQEFYWFVRRSNKKTEPWMHHDTWRQAVGIASIPKWRAWWNSNKNDFKVVKSIDEAVLERIQVD